MSDEKNISLLIKIKTFQGPFAPKQFAHDGASEEEEEEGGEI